MRAGSLQRFQISASRNVAVTTWFAASILFAFDNVYGPQTRWYVWEDVVLFEAPSHEEVMAKAQAYAKVTVDANADAALPMGGQLAHHRFIGVRKILTISNPTHLDIDPNDHPPVDGTEITFTEFIVESRDDLERLAKGERVHLVYGDYSRDRLPPERLVYLLGERFPDLAPIHKEHRDAFGEILPHIFFGDLTRRMVSLLEPAPGGDAVERRRKLAEVLAMLEKTYADGDEEIQDFISASFLEPLPRPGESGSEIRQMLGPRLTIELRAIEAPETQGTEGTPGAAEKNEAAQLLLEPTNYAVVQLPGRRFPGVVFQGDSLNILVEELGDLLSLAKKHLDGGLMTGLEMLEKRLRGVSSHYEAVCRARGISLPYPEK